jgi:hypothetical protein
MSAYGLFPPINSNDLTWFEMYGIVEPFPHKLVLNLSFRGTSTAISGRSGKRGQAIICWVICTYMVYVKVLPLASK